MLVETDLLSKLGVEDRETGPEVSEQFCHSGLVVKQLVSGDH